MIRERGSNFTAAFDAVLADAALAKDARGLLAALDGQDLGPVLAQAAALLAAVTGQDLDEGDDGVFRIARACRARG